jgi:hypothetical protein
MISFRNNFRVSLHKPSTDTFFVEEITISSAAFPTPAEQAEAVRRMYENAEPKIDVLLITQMKAVETAWF